MIPTGPGFRTSLRVNVTFFIAALFAALAWLCWPETKEGWRLGLFAILCGYGSVVLTITGVGIIREQLSRDRPVRRLERQARMPRSDGFADKERMRKEGVIE